MIETGRDESLDVFDLLRGSTEEVKKTPLEEMQERKQLGVVVDKNELIKDQDDSKRSFVDNDRRNEDVDKTLNDMDETIEKLKYIGKIKKPENKIQMAELMSHLDDIDLEELKEKASREGVGPIEVTDTPVINPVVTEQTDDEPSFEERNSRIDIIIDKTGFGKDVIFTEEERAKITSAEEIRVVEVEEVKLETAKVKKAGKSFLDTIAEYKSIGIRTPMTFPCSRFRAEISGLTYGEYGDLALSTTKNDFDTTNKILSLIYNKMHNASIGNFESYEDFLHKFAWVDVPLAKLALYISTNPENDTIGLHCNVPECNKDFPHPFSTRSLVRIERMSDSALEWMEKAASASHKEALEMFESAPHRMDKRIKLKNSGWLVNIGYISCYQYLHNVINNTIDEVFRENHPDDINGILQFYGIFMENITSISIPDGEGGYIEFDEFNDIIEALYHLDPVDFDIIKTLVYEYSQTYDYEFGVTNIRCPHCGNITEYVSVDLDRLVFLSYQRRLTTNVKLKNVEHM